MNTLVGKAVQAIYLSAPATGPKDNSLSTWLRNNVVTNLSPIAFVLCIAFVLIAGIKIMAKMGKEGGFREAISSVGMILLGAAICAMSGVIAALLWGFGSGVA